MSLAPNTAGHSDRLRIGIDVGGTFTDLVIADEAGSLQIVKVPSVPEKPEVGIMNALRKASAEREIEIDTLLGRTDTFIHGSTVATNTLLEKKGCRVGLITTSGFRDTIEIRRGIRKNPWRHRDPFPEVLVPRYLRKSISARMDSRGKEIRPLVAAEIAEIVEWFREEKVEAVAIALFNSYLNPEHESECAAIVSDLMPEVAVSTSSELMPIMGEYERSYTAVLNAYVQVKTGGYLKELSDELRRNGLGKTPLIVQSNGGILPVEASMRRPVALLLSGPAAGASALKTVGAAGAGDELITMEIGGTSCDVMIMSKGQIATTEQFEVSDYPAALPAIDIHTIGAGGGTIAGVDRAGMMFVGPQGAGARPGPACYGHGGEHPTVTDAHIVLGRLRSGDYANGALVLDRDLATRAIEEKLAKPLGIDVEAAATGILRLVEQHLLHAVLHISLQRGYNPANFTLVPGGGAGPLHGVSVARLLGCRKVYVPRTSGAFCAFGMLNSDVRYDFTKVHPARLDETSARTLDGFFEELEDSAREAMAEQTFEGETIRFTRVVFMRYASQQWDLQIETDGAMTMDELARAFEAEHERRNGHFQPGGVILVSSLRLTAIGVTTPPASGMSDHAADAAVEPIATNTTYFGEAEGWIETPIYRGDDLRPGCRLSGPAIIEERTTTVLLGPDDVLDVDRAGNFAIEVALETKDA